MNIFIGNLSMKTTEDDLREEFTRFGEVTSVTIMNDRYIGSGQPNAYGYIQMISKEGAETAIANMEGKILNDRAIKVVAALPMTKYGGKNPEKTGKAWPSSKRKRKTMAGAPDSGE
jgi:RNA recognition motif-containing protein